MSGQCLRRVLSMDVGMRHLGVAILTCGLPTPGVKVVPHVELLCVYDVLQQCGSDAKCTSVSKLDMVRLMCQFLHSMEQTWDVLHVTDLVVESQVRKSPKNLNIMVTLFAWFYGMHLRHQALVPSHVIPHLFQVSAKNKLTLSDVPCTKASYPQRKKQAIDHLRELAHAHEVTINPAWHVRYSIEKKRDDMADAVLQALWYIKHKILGQPEVGSKKPKKPKKPKAAKQVGPKQAGKGKGKGKKGKTNTSLPLPSLVSQASLETSTHTTSTTTKCGAGKGKGKGKKRVLSDVTPSPFSMPQKRLKVGPIDSLFGSTPFFDNEP